MHKTISWLHIFDTVPARRTAAARFVAPAHPVYLWLAYGLIAANAVFLLSYFFGVNSYATEGYEIKKIQTRIAELSTENKKLMVKISEQNSIARLQNEVANSSFVPVGSTMHVQQQQLTKK